MLHASLRWAAGVAVGWFYREIAVEGIERVPADAPLLVAANHPNQLIDALLVGLSLGREVTYTGKAILMDSPVSAFVLKRLPFVPLRRAADERKAADAGQGGATVDRGRNADSFRAILDALGEHKAVLIFPEGISHHRPELAPIKTGVARIALQALDERGLADLHVVPVGLTFERKWAPRTRVLVEVGEPIRMGDWRADGEHEVEALTREVDRRLRAVTLNFPTVGAAAEVLGVSDALGGAAAGADDVRSLGAPDAPLAGLAALARRGERVRAGLEAAGPNASARADALRAGVAALAAELEALGVEAGDLGVDTRAGAGARFTLRELGLGLVGAPVAAWGKVNHWPALALARFAAGRTSREVEDPAMHTVVAGLALVPLFYLLQGAVVGVLTGWWWALAYVATLPAAGTWALRFADRWTRARRRARAYVAFRRRPEVQRRLVAEVVRLRGDAEALERMVSEAGAALAPSSVA